MKFQFEYLRPKDEVIKIIENYEKLGYTPYFDSEYSSEEQQIFDDSNYVVLFFKKDSCDTLPLYLPKTSFKKKIEYYDWMSREEFEELCEQDKAYRCAECVLVTNIDRFESFAKNSKSMVCMNPYVLRIGSFGTDGRWWSYGDLADMSRYKYVKLIKREQE